MTWYMEAVFVLMLVTALGNLWTARRNYIETGKLIQATERLKLAAERTREELHAIQSLRGVAAGKPGGDRTVAGVLR
jgi:hypothetical protein